MKKEINYIYAVLGLTVITMVFYVPMFLIKKLDDVLFKKYGFGILERK